MATPDDVAGFLRDRGVTLLEYVVLVACHYSPKPWWGQVGDAWDSAEAWGIPGVTHEAVEAAMASCLERGLIRIIGPDDLREIEEGLAAEGLGEPVYGFPAEGEVDFTRAGSELYKELDALRPDQEGSSPGASTVPADARRDVLYCPTLEIAAAQIEWHQRLPDVASVSDPVRIGPWCVWWWESFPVGYRVEVVYREDRPYLLDPKPG